jgi:hypothetical protein
MNRSGSIKFDTSKTLKKNRDETPDNLSGNWLDNVAFPG